MAAKEKVEEIMSKAQAWGKEAFKRTQEDLEKVEFLQKMEDTTRVPKLFLAGGAVVFILLLFLFNEGARFVVNVTSFVFPAYESFRAIEHPASGDSKIWLSYWVVMGAWNLLDIFADFITYWLPFYYLIKVAAVIYLWHPRSRGIKPVHEKLSKVMPGFLKSE